MSSGREGSSPAGRALTLSSGGIVATLGVMALALIAAGFAVIALEQWTVQGRWAGEVRESLIRLFSLDREANVPTWFSVALLLIAAALAAVSGLLARAGDRLHWLVGALLLTAMSLDEAALLHEMSIKPLRYLLSTGGLLYYAWVIPGLVAVGAVALAYGRFALALPRRVRLRLVTGAALYVSGALLIEAVTGLIEERSGRDVAYYLLSAVEEGFEMGGLIVIITGLLLHLESDPRPIAIHLADR